MNDADVILDEIYEIIIRSRVMEDKDPKRAYLYLLAGIRKALYEFEMKIHERGTFNGETWDDE